YVPADGLHRIVERLLAPAGDEHVRALRDEQLGRGERHAGRGGRDHRDLALELSHASSDACRVSGEPTLECAPPRPSVNGPTRRSPARTPVLRRARGTRPSTCRPPCTPRRSRAGLRVARARAASTRHTHTPPSPTH